MAKSAPYHFVSDACEGQTCQICGEEATHKLGEEIPNDEPCPQCDETWKLVTGCGDGPLVTGEDRLSQTIPGVHYPTATVVFRERLPEERCLAIWHSVLGVPRHNLTAYVCCEHFRMIVGPAAPCEDPEKPPYEDGFICGTGLDDPEHASWTHEVYVTREEAIAAGNEDVTWTEYGFQTARIRSEKTFMPNPLSAEHACDQAENDEMGEAMLENWQDKVFGRNGKLIEELQATLDKVWSDFEEKYNLWSWGFWFDDVEHHEFHPEAAPVLPTECTDMSPTSGSHKGHGCRFDDAPPVVTTNELGHNVIASPGVNEKIDALARGESPFVPWGDRPPRTNGGETCDMWTGPCACGATHTDGL